MKRSVVLIIMALLVAVIPVQAQRKKKRKMSKTEKAEYKKYKKELKQVDPLEYKALLEKQQKTEQDLAASSKQTEELQAQNDSLKKAMETKENEVAALKKELEECVSIPLEKGEVDVSPNRHMASNPEYEGNNGIVFKVQIGAFTNPEFQQFLVKFKHFTGEQDKDGLRKFTLGYFDNYWDADNFKKYLRTMGVNDAWIVAYKNGERQDMKSVLENMPKN